MNKPMKYTNKYHKLTRSQSLYYYLKMVLDFLISLIALIVLALVFLIVAIAIKIDDGGPVFFSQKRIGKGKQEFAILKFRTMRIDAPHDMPTHMLKEASSNITRVGGVLRKFSIDELPQLWNILTGKMSLVGPRPALYNQFDLIEERERYGVHQVKPGLTGWAQVNGRDELENPLKAALDGEYIQKFGIVMDIRCFFKTFFAVLGAKGVVEGSNEDIEQQEKGKQECKK